MAEPFRLYLPLENRKWINANGRLFWRERAKRTKDWRVKAAWAAEHAGIPALPGGRVVCELRFADDRRRDPANWAPTAKACIDGLVDARVFVDDSHKYVIGPDMRIGEKVPRSDVGLWLFIHPWERKS